MKLRMVPIFLAALSGFAVTNASATVLTFYNNRAAWEAAVGGSFVEQDFNSFTSGVSYESAPLDVGDFSVSVSGTTFGSIWHNIGPVSNLNDVNGSPQINAAVGAIGGTSLYSGNADIRAESVGQFSSTPVDSRTAIGKLVDLGFKVAALSPITVRVNGPGRLFQKHFGLKFEKKATDV